MADASVTAIDGRAVVRVGGSELLDIYIGQAIVASGQATASAEAAAAPTTLTTPPTSTISKRAWPRSKTANPNNSGRSYL